MTSFINRNLPPREWEPFFRKAGVRVEELDGAKSSKARSIKIGLFLSPLVDREVPIQVEGRSGKAVLRVADRRSKEKRYYFDVTWDHESDGGTVPVKNTGAENDQVKPPAAVKATEPSESAGATSPKTEGKKAKAPDPSESAGVTTPESEREKAKNLTLGNNEDW